VVGPHSLHIFDSELPAGVTLVVNGGAGWDYEPAKA